MDKPTRFKKDEKVLCHHQGMLYEGKVLDSKFDEDGDTPLYLMHYQGWNNRWDEWVTEERILERNEENLKKQKEINGSVIQSQSGGKTGHKNRPGESSGTSTPANRPKSTGGKSKHGAESASGPSTPFDGSMKATFVIGDGAGLELESRASTPSMDGGASVTSTSTTGQVAQSGSNKRKGGGKQKGNGGDSVPNTPDIDGQGGDAETPASKKKRRRTTASANSKTGAMQPPSKADTEGPATGVESHDMFRSRRELKIVLPEELKEVVVDDWDLVTRQNKLCEPPAEKNIDRILDDYIKYKIDKARRDKENEPVVRCARETVAGIREYFNEMCGVHLLYKFERQRYNEILAKEEKKAKASADGAKRSLTSYYGFPHLLRLFVKMGTMLAYTDLNQKEIDQIMAWIKDFVVYLSKTLVIYFNPDDYKSTNPEYYRNAFTN